MKNIHLQEFNPSDFYSSAITCLEKAYVDLVPWTVLAYICLDEIKGWGTLEKAGETPLYAGIAYAAYAATTLLAARHLDKPE